jgi:hypothetical protein
MAAESDGEVYKRHCRVMGKATTHSNWREAKGRERESKGENTPTIDGLKRVLRQAKWRGSGFRVTQGEGGPGTVSVSAAHSVSRGERKRGLTGGPMAG